MRATERDLQAAEEVLEALDNFARTVHEEHGEYLGDIFERSAMANLDQTRCHFSWLAREGELR